MAIALHPDVRTASPAIGLDHVTKAFRLRGRPPVTALADISLEVHDGEIAALLGPSGCGKSTLLNIISGITSPTSGSILFRGVPASAVRSWSEIGYMFQEDRLFPWRSAVRNVEFSLEARRMPAQERRERARRALALVGLSDFERAYSHQLSGGMRSRVALARSLVSEPRILLMDEPFARLDAQTRAAMHDELLKIWSGLRMSIVFVTHDVTEAVALADRVIVLAPRPGRIREIVPTDLPRPRAPAARAVIDRIQLLQGLIGRG